MAGELIHKAAEWDKQSSRLLKKYHRVEDLTNEGGYVWQPKYNGTLREPRFKAVRWDKSKADDDKS